nr:hypothetical protein [Acetobacter estunensis]
MMIFTCPMVGTVHQTLPVPGLHPMLLDGAARFGRRTPEPHVWPAAPSTLARGDGWRGASMADSDKKNWLDSLQPVDRRTAERLLQDIGESAFTRIARAYVSVGAKRGAPPKKLHEDWIAEGYRLWLLSENASFKKIAEQVISADKAIHENERQGRIRALESALRKTVRKREAEAELLTVAELKERLSMPDLLTKIELSLAIHENHIRRDCSARDLYSYISKELKIIDSRLNFQKRCKTNTFGLIAKTLEIYENSIDEYRRRKEAKRNAIRDNAFFEAFSDIIPEELPVSVAYQWKKDCTNFLRAEVQRWRETTKNA